MDILSFKTAKKAINLINAITDEDITAVINNAIIQTDIENRLNAKEQEYAPRLTNAENNITTNTGNITRLIDKFPNNAGAHNSIYRGKFLGNAVTAAQYTAIANGTFEDMYIGDYWTIDGINWRIACFNYYHNAGNILSTVHHVTLVPDTTLYTHVMNDSNTTDGGYVGSKMYISGLDQAKTIINAAFNGHILNHRKFLCNAVTDGEASGGAWFDSTVELMNEIMVYGSIVNGSATDGLYNIGIEKIQLPLFALRPDIVNIRSSYWLRDVSAGTSFAYVTAIGAASHHTASNANGVRPVFSIIG